jgi:hypothetical protein
MKIFTLTILAALTLLAAPVARAWTYNDGDLLLVFRNGSQDVEFDLGSVTNFLGQTNGYTTTVTGWDPTLVTSTFGSFAGVNVVLLATGGATNWLSGAEPDTTAYNVSAQAANSLHGVINAIGNKPLYPINIPTAGPNAYSIDVGGQYETSSYDYVVSGGHFSGIPQLGGYAPFTVEQAVPGYLDFWQVQSSSVYPNPPPDNLVGTFYITSAGALTFVAGPRPSAIAGITVAGNISSIKFSTIVGNTYSIAYTSVLGSPISTWPVDRNSLIGNGRISVISHTNNNNSQEFYQVKTQ